MMLPSMDDGTKGVCMKKLILAAVICAISASACARKVDRKKFGPQKQHQSKAVQPEVVVLKKADGLNSQYRVEITLPSLSDDKKSVTFEKIFKGTDEFAVENEAGEKIYVQMYGSETNMQGLVVVMPLDNTTPKGPAFVFGRSYDSDEFTMDFMWQSEQTTDVEYMRKMINAYGKATAKVEFTEKAEGLKAYWDKNSELTDVQIINLLESAPTAH